MFSPQPPGVLGDPMDHVAKSVAAEVRRNTDLVPVLARVPDRLVIQEAVTLTNVVRNVHNLYIGLKSLVQGNIDKNL